MLLHLYNKNRYIALDLFEKVFPGRNRYLAFDNVTPLTSKSELYEKYKIETVTKNNIKAIIQSIDFSIISCIIVHYMTYDKIRFIHKVPKSVKVCWVSYGGDLYNDFLYYKGYNLYYKNPAIFYYKHKPIKRLLTSIALPIRAKITFNYLVKRINSFSSCLYVDTFIFEQFAKKQVDKKELFFWDINSLKKICNKGFTTGNSIMVGHSASQTNNHLYSLKFIKNLKLNERKIYLQLGYGGNAYYRKFVSEKFIGIFHNNGVINSNFIPREDYFKFLLNFNTFIFSHWRQEALSNIFFGFYYGVKIFLSNKNPIFNYFKKQGFIFFELEKMNQKIFDEELTNEQKLYNRSLMETLYSFDKLIRLIKVDFS